jgi:hypothetical protein
MSLRRTTFKILSAVPFKSAKAAHPLELATPLLTMKSLTKILMMLMMMMKILMKALYARKKNQGVQ